MNFYVFLLLNDEFHFMIIPPFKINKDASIFLLKLLTSTVIILIMYEVFLIKFQTIIIGLELNKIQSLSYMGKAFMFQW